MISSNTNTYKGLYNELKTIQFLCHGNKATDRSEGINDLDFTAAIATFSAIQLDQENARASIMAMMAEEYCRETLNWRSLGEVYHCPRRMEFSNPVLERYSEHSNPSDIVLLSPANQTLGLSLKSYSTQSPESHKSTSFTNFHDVLGFREPPETREEAYDLFLEVMKEMSPIDIVGRIIHLTDLPYITIMAKGDYHNTKYTLNEAIQEVNKVDIVGFRESSRFDFKITHSTGVKDARIYFKTAKASKPGVPKNYNTIQTKFI